MAEDFARSVQDLIASALPSGGKVGLAAVVFVAAVFLVKFASERASSRVQKLFDESWQAVLALALAGGGFLLFPQPRYVPLVLGLIAAIVCLWASNSSANSSDSDAKLQFWRYPIRRASIATLVLALFVPVYFIAHVVEHQFLLERAARLKAEEGQVIVAFVLPSHKPAEDYLDLVDSAEFEKRTFEQIYVTLRDAAAASELKVEILPVNASIAEFESLKQRFPPRNIDRTDLIQKLVNNFPDHSPVDIVLQSNMTVINEVTNKSRYSFQAYEFDWQKQDLTLIAEFRYEFEGLASEHEVRRIALLVATKFSHFLIKTFPNYSSEEGFTLTADLEQKIWAYYEKLFKQHFVEYTDYYQKEDPDWDGHALAQQAGSASYSRVLDWYKAFSLAPPDPGAEERYDIQRNVTRHRSLEAIRLSPSGTP